MSLKTACRYGHPYTDENTMWRQKPRKNKVYTIRECRCCRSIADRISYYYGGKHKPRLPAPDVETIVRQAEAARGMRRNALTLNAGNDETKRKLSEAAKRRLARARS